MLQFVINNPPVALLKRFVEVGSALVLSEEMDPTELRQMLQLASESRISLVHSSCKDEAVELSRDDLSYLLQERGPSSPRMLLHFAGTMWSSRMMQRKMDSASERQRQDRLGSPQANVPSRVESYGQLSHGGMSLR